MIFMNALFSKIRHNDVLANLPAEQRATLNQWLLDRVSFAQVAENLAKPPPEGFAIKTNRESVRQYYNRFILAEQVAESFAIADTLPCARASLKNLLQQSALTTALQTELPPTTFQILARYYRNLTREQFDQRAAEQRDLQLQLNRERLNHHRRVFEFNAARAALAAACQLQQIANDPHMDDEQKIWAAQERIFGALPDTEPKPKPLHQFIQ